jgi:predicted nucleic acid-binding protein
MNGHLATELRGAARVLLDTNVFIYYLQQEPRFEPCVAPVFEMIARGEIKAFTSVITLLEVLVQPIRLGRRDLATKYVEILSQSPNISLVPVDVGIARRGGEIRATMPGNLKPPDAIQLATAEATGVSCVVTNDRGLRTFGGARVLLVEDYVGGHA